MATWENQLLSAISADLRHALVLSRDVASGMADGTGDTLARSRSRSSDHNDRLEPHLLRAAENDNVEQLEKIIDAARKKGQLNENFLRIGLMRSSEKGATSATEYLLNKGAKPDGAVGNRLSPLLRAVEHNNVAIVKVLLGHGANPEARGKRGRTALMYAAWKNHWHILDLLITKGADVNGKDERGRNVLHNLAADKNCDWGQEVIQLLLSQDIHIDGPDGQDNLGRSPLHWACATGKLRLAEQLLTRPKNAKANINAVEIREKTSLHLAAAHDKSDIVEMLLRYQANIDAKSDGGWTALHAACEKGFVEVVRILLKAGADINAKLLNGMSPLHYAAQGGHVEVVMLLLGRKDIKRAARDIFGFTPFLRAAQHKRKDIVQILAPFRNVEILSEDALGACNGFSATIVDFGDFRNENRVERKTVYELLYAKDRINDRKPAITVLPSDKASRFRWIHLPANNMAWVEPLLTKLFLEEETSDVEGFKALEKSFGHQHHGQRSHSHFMRPLCQSTPRLPRMPKEETFQSVKSEASHPIIVISDGPDYPPPETPSRSNPSRESSRLEEPKSSSHDIKKDQPKGASKEKGKKVTGKGSKSPRIGTETPTKEQQPKSNLHSGSKQNQSGNRHARSPSSPGRKEAVSTSKGNIFLFMPYLHFETKSRQAEMQEAIRRAETLRSPTQKLARASTYDEMLIRAHLSTSTVSLHVRRTLDQSFYHNIDTESRDQDQVVYRYQTKGKALDECDPKIVMVDQLWMWILGPNLIITAFPQRWQQPRNDPLNVLDSIIEDINSKTRDPVTSVYDLAMIITNRCAGVFDRHRMGDEEYQFLDMFESSIGNATDRETVLFKEFNQASAQASEWLQHHRQPGRLARIMDIDSSDTKVNEKQCDEWDDKVKFEEYMRGPLFVDKLLDIGQETDLLAETKDIRDELNMIAKVFEDQRHVLKELEDGICDIYFEEQQSQKGVKKRFQDQQKTITMHLKDIERMDKQVERTHSAIIGMLDLKQKHANAFEARFARDQAAGTAKQSQIIMVFTIVTIVFLPLSFIAAFFAINIEEFPRTSDGSASLPLGYVSKYLFGIGFAVSIPLIVIALVLDDIKDVYWQFKKRYANLRNRSPEGNETFNISETTLNALKLEQMLSTTRSMRRSVDNQWISERLSRDTARTRREKITGFRMRVSQDIERGAREFG